MAVEWLGLVKEFPLFKPRVQLSLAYFCTGMALLLHDRFPLQLFGPDIRQYQPWATMAALLFWSLWLGHVGEERKQAKARREQEETILASLHSLASEEILILAYCVHHGHRSVPMPLFTPAANSLRAKGLLILSSQAFREDSAVWTIPQFVWDHLHFPPIREEWAKGLQGPQAQEALARFNELVGPGSYYRW